MFVLKMSNLCVSVTENSETCQNSPDFSRVSNSLHISNDSGEGSWDGAVVRALASHQCVPGSIPGPGVTCGLSLLLVLFLAPRGFSPGTPLFRSPQKPTTFPNSNSIWNCQALYHEPLARVIAQALPVLDIIAFTFFFHSDFSFDLIFFFTKNSVKFLKS